MFEIFIIVWSIWILFEIIVNRLIHSGEEDKEGTDQGSISLIWVTIAISITLAIFAFVFYEKKITNSVIIYYAGLGLIIAGMIFRIHAIRSLGHWFTVDITIRPHHQLKKDGIYKRIRHPSYTGMLLSFLGFGISLNNWLSLSIVFIPVFLSMLNRMNKEEKMLIEHFGEEYKEYQKSSWKLIPWIY